jgi:hypothetical protein
MSIQTWAEALIERDLGIVGRCRKMAGEHKL